MPTAERIGGAEARSLFAGLEKLRGLVLGVSGGPDSTALMLLAARWVKSRRRAPKLLAVTVDHGLRPEAAAEAAAVARLARHLGIAHRTLRWRGAKPQSGLQEAARQARYRLLAEAASRAGYRHIATAHTLDDQAETVLFRLARGSGLTGLAAMAAASPVPGQFDSGIILLRPLLHIAKARLEATLGAAGITYSRDPSNRDPRFARVRLRDIMPGLAREGLDAHGLARLATRMRRADAAIEFAVGAARRALASQPSTPAGPVTLPAAQFAALPAEVALRLLGQAIAHVGDEGPVELAKLEALYGEIGRNAPSRLRRTLAGAMITLNGDRLTVERAPARRNSATRKGRNRRFTK